MLRSLLFGFALLMGLSTGAMAHGPMGGPWGGNSDGWYLPFGIDVGGSFGDGGHFIYGAEVSLVRAEALAWTGLVASVLTDSGRGVGGTLAVEAGFLCFGAEAGYTLRPDGEHGVRARLVFPFMAVTPYVGLDAAGPMRGTYGVLFKIPSRPFDDH